LQADSSVTANLQTRNFSVRSTASIRHSFRQANGKENRSHKDGDSEDYVNQLASHFALLARIVLTNYLI
jgi:hypothetical protein